MKKMRIARKKVGTNPDEKTKECSVFAGREEN
jgi:hypothetical protein